MDREYNKQLDREPARAGLLARTSVPMPAADSQLALELASPSR